MTSLDRISPDPTSPVPTSLHRIHAVLDRHAKLGVPASTLASDADLYAAGMTSHASVNVMLALEDEFDIEFPDELLSKATFCTTGSLRVALASLEAVSA